MTIRRFKDNPGRNDQLLITHTVDISNTLYGSDILSAYELAHEFGNLFIGKPVILSNDIIKAQWLLETKRKRTRNLQRKYSMATSLSVEDIVKAYISSATSTPGKLTFPRLVPQFDADYRSLNAAESKENSIKAAAEDIFLVVTDELFA